ncbi:class I SAM-dependent methyltransferase [Nesterenkonia halophila]|uniref:class I SAM-dependent methyltransferase n=1 Tax=Nesterenkonia halophila TaxID=302044 RepID=UPI001FE7C7E4|nr:class I SAM-dependent methyltransferase [Nesterenkonia halophila]
MSADDGAAGSAAGPITATSAAYDARAAEYIARLGALEQMAGEDRTLITRWRDAIRGPMLDVGCGPGHWTALLAEGGREVLGVDVSAEMIASARARWQVPEFRQADAEGLPVPTASRGAVLAWYSLIHLPPERLPTGLAEISRVLAPGGSLLLGFFRGEAGERFEHAVTPAWYWSPEMLEELLAEAGFAVEERHARHDPGSRPHGAMVARRR